MRFGAPWLRWFAAMLVCSAVASAATNVSVASEPEVAAAAGAYATLVFPVSAEGTFRYEISAPEGWGVVTRGDRATFDGAGAVSVTVRVPLDAPAGGRAGTELRLYDGEHLVTTATGWVSVTRTHAIDLRGPGDLTGTLDTPLTFEVVASNDGNATETVRFEARHTHWEVRFAPAEVRLEAGERRAVTVTLRPTTTVNSGFRHIFHVVATADADPGSEAVAEVVSRFYEGGEPIATRADRPRITLNVATRVAAGLAFEDDIVTAHASYAVSPSLAGGLSDYVEGSVRSNGLAGTAREPLAETPSSMVVSLQGPNWDGGFSASPHRYAVSGGADLGDWRVSGGASVVPGGQASANARLDSLDPGLDLQLAARTGLRAEQRTDTVAASYATELRDGLSLTVGTEVQGFAGPGYQVALGLSERLGWENEAYYLAQSYAGVPLAGVHTLGLSGGTRRTHPFGVRARTAYSLSSVTDRWTNGVTVFAAPLPGVTLDVTGDVTLSRGGTRDGLTWSLSPRARYAIQPFEGFSARFIARYGHGGVLSGVGTTWDRYQAGARLTYANLGLQGAAEYEVRRAALATASADVGWRASARADYGLPAFGGESRWFAAYRYLEDTSPRTRVRHEVGLGWEQDWTADLSSRLAYERSFDPLGSGGFESLAASLRVRDLFTSGLHLGARYGIRSPTGLLDFAGDYRHDLSMGLGYDLAVAFDTPDPVVDLFGGRRGGEVYGIAFLDADRDGTPGDGERALAGLTVRIGPETAVTDADGHYRIRVPEGRYDLAFPAGMPATVDLRGEATVEVRENERIERPLALVPVVNLEVELFHDLDHDGVMSASEGGIPFGGVALEGPERRVVRTDASGRAMVAGLAPGTYLVTAADAYLPQGYRVTGDVGAVTLEPGARTEPVRIGAARPPRRIVRTFGDGALAVMPRALSSTVPAGAEVEIEAWVQGTADRVVVVHAGGESELVADGAAWRGRVRVARDATLGPMTLQVRAEGEAQQVERPVFLTIVDRPPFTAPGVVAGVGEQVDVEVRTLFAADDAALDMPDGATLEMGSSDGYRWTAQWRAPAEAGRYQARLAVDGEELGAVPISVFAPESAHASSAADGERSPTSPDLASSGRAPRDP